MSDWSYTRSVLVKLGDLWVHADAILAIEPNPLPANQPAITVHVGPARVVVPGMSVEQAIQRISEAVKL